MKINVLIEGHAGQGPNALAKVIGNVLIASGYYVFISRDYGSFIRGGHNSNIVSFSDKPIMSNTSSKDILILLGEDTYKWHEKDVKKYKHVLKGGEDNMYFAGAIAKLLGLNFELVSDALKSIGNFEKNLSAAKKGYGLLKEKIALKALNNKFRFIDGSKGIADGAVKSGLDVYFAYPMTPATGVMNELADKQIQNNYFVFEMENEISVINAAIGAACTGAKSMIGTSGGGFDLMTEALSLTGQAEVPLVIYLAQRVGPGTGSATYTEQSDLHMARHAGHGEFPRLVVAAGDPIECAELTSQAFYFSQKYKIPALVLSDKHLAESIYSVHRTPVISASEKSNGMKKYSSYEHDVHGIETDKAEMIKANVEKRNLKREEIEKEAEKLAMFKVYGNEKSNNLVLFWGSTKGAVLDAIADLNVKAMQVLYMEPFSGKIKAELQKAKRIIVVENNATSQLSSLIAEKTGIMIENKNKILRYDGRPFFSDELAKEIKGRMR